MSDELRRSDDQMIGKLIQALEDDRRSSKEWRDRHDQESREWRLSIDDRLKPIETFIKSANWSYKFLLGLSAFAFGVIRLWSFVKDHIK